MKKLNTYIIESENKQRIDFSNKNNELRVREEVKKEIKDGSLKNNAEMAEHYQTILGEVFSIPDICKFNDDDLRIFYCIVDDEYDKAGFTSDLTDVEAHKKEVKRQLEKLTKLQNEKHS